MLIKSGGSRWKVAIGFINKTKTALRHYRRLNQDTSTFGTYNKDGLTKMLNHLPLFLCGEIVRGFGRGSRELGIPTANYPLEVVKSLPDDMPTGVYYGWANVDNDEVRKMVMSIGWNPFYQNKEKSLETHILHEFKGDLYGHTLKICIVGYIRPEKSFDSLEGLITAIKEDIEEAHKQLDSDPNKIELKNASFFKA